VVIMPVLRAWIKTIDSADVSKAGGLPSQETQMLRDTAAAASVVLKSYLDRCLRRIPSTPFSQAQVGIDPTSSQVGPKDLLVHLTQSSLIRSVAARQNFQIAGGGISPGGGTVDFPQGVLSEVYWITVKNMGNGAASRGTVLANLAIHEIAHNKCQRIPNLDPVSEVHGNGGGGLFATGINRALASGGTLLPDNEKFLAKYLGRDVPQYSSWLFNPDLGF